MGEAHHMDKGSETSQPNCVSEIHHSFGWEGGVLLINYQYCPSFSGRMWLSP